MKYKTRSPIVDAVLIAASGNRHYDDYEPAYWIVTHPDGRIEYLSQRHFYERYESVDGTPDSQD